MKKITIITIVVGVVILLVAAVILFAYVYHPQTKIQQKIETQTVAATCQIPADAKRSNLMMTIGSLQINQTKNSVQDLITRFGGQVTSFNDNMFPMYPDSGAPASRNVMIIATLPSKSFDDFTTAARKLADSPNLLQNQNINVQNQASLQEECDSLAQRMIYLKQSEKMYSQQPQENLQPKEGQYAPYPIDNMRQEMMFVQSSLDNFSKNFYKTEINITITDQGIGG